ncbi:MAG: lytic transglycosylase domain-containing protein [Alphaproteobacteria bacterium]|nr:lytic transglycosylase domain-containing protein [Alphaproteobacteria bacterium]
MSLWFAAVVFFGAWPFAANSSVKIQTSEGGICQAAAQRASQETGVPLDVLLAITLSETGRKEAGRFLPWPWTVNMEGKGRWFENQKDALAYVNANFKIGARSFDVGCFQINFKWHGKAFSSIDRMFDPDSNALYAAKYLRSLYYEKGNWKEAAGAYHSRTSKNAAQYANRFSRILLALNGPLAGQESTKSSVRPRKVVPKSNQYPLLKSGVNSTFTNGSLVSLVASDTQKSLIKKPPGRLF